MFRLITLSKQYRYSILDFEKLILIKVHSPLTSKLQNLLAIGLYAHTCVCVCGGGGGLGDGIAMDDFFCQVGWWLGVPCPIDRKKESSDLI